LNLFYSQTAENPPAGHGRQPKPFLTAENPEQCREKKSNFKF